MGAALAEGHITSAPYFHSLETPANQRTTGALQRRFGGDQMANQCLEAAYFQIHLLADAMSRADPDDIDSLQRALPGSEFDAPQGRVRIDEQNHHTHLYPRIGRVNVRGQFDILEETRERVRPDPYLVSHTLQDWSVRTGLRSSA